MFVRVGIKKWDAHRWENAQMHYIPLGYFTVDESPRKLAKITLSALDRMVKFDKTVDWSPVTFPITVGDLLMRACSICNVPLGIKASDLLNYKYIVTDPPEVTNLTWRQVLSCIAEITGTCAFVDWNGHLILKWYEKTDVSIAPSDRYTSDLYERKITITGVQISTDDEEFLAGSDEYAFNISDNPLIQHDHAALAASLYEKLGGFSYTPFSAEIKHYPQIYPLDIVSFVDRNGATHETIVTDVTFTLNQNTLVEGKGETSTKNGYASAAPLTKKQQSIIEKMRREQNRQLNNREQAMIQLNDTIWNSLGLHTTVIDDGTGGKIYYYHDGATLDDSTIIYTMRAGGFAWTDKWEGDETVWQYGVTRDGNAVINILTAYKIQAEQIEAEAITAEKLSLEYRRSVEDSIEDKVNESEGILRQEFEVGFGQLRSTITSEVSAEELRARQAEESLRSNIESGISDLEGDMTVLQQTFSSEMQQLAWEMSARVTQETARAQQTESGLLEDLNGKGAQIEKLSAQVDLIPGEIELSVSKETARAQEVEEELLTSLRLTETQIEAKVSKGDICAGIKAEVTEDGADVEIRGNHLIVESDNFNLSKQGEVEASGSFKSKNGDAETSISGGKLSFSRSGIETLSITAALGVGNSYASEVDYTGDLMFSRDGLVDIMFVSGGQVNCTRVQTTDITAFGNLNVFGSKNRAVLTEHYGCRALAAMESAMPVFSDMGSAQCGEDGIAIIALDPIFAETVNTDYCYQVFLTQVGDKKVEYVLEKNPTYFTVKGDPHAKFDWIIYLPQKGYTGTRLEEIDQPKQPEVGYDMTIFNEMNALSALCDQYINDYFAELEKLVA